MLMVPLPRNGSWNALSDTTALQHRRLVYPIIRTFLPFLYFFTYAPSSVLKISDFIVHIRRCSCAAPLEQCPLQLSPLLTPALSPLFVSRHQHETVTN